MVAAHPKLLARTLAIAIALAIAGCGSDGDDDGGGTNGNVDGNSNSDGNNDGNVDGSDNGDGDGNLGSVDEPDDGETVAVRLADLSGEVTRFGTVSIEQPGDGPLDDEDGGIFGGFLEFNQTFPALAAVENFQPAPDTCTVDVFNLGDGVGDFDFDVEFDSLSAGEQLLLSAGGSSYVEIPREQAFGFTLYQLGAEQLPGPLPSDLVLDIPGEQYPAFSAVPVPNVAPLTGLTAPAIDPATGFPTPITAETVFGWDAGADPDVYIVISASVSEFGDDGISVTSVDCLAIDDGEFAFPAATRAELGDTFSDLSASVARLGVTIRRQGNTLLFVTNQSGG